MYGPLGMFGGAFDPPHLGHLIVARDVLERLRLDRLLIVPTARPPHREVILPAEDRLRLVRKACAGEPGFEVCDAEFHRSGPSYTVDTLAWIRATYAPAELYCIIGGDQFRLFSSWHRHDRILQLATMVVMTRAGDEPLGSEARIPHVAVEVTRVDLSSTRIRERLVHGRSIRYLVPDAILGDVEGLWRKRGVREAALAESGAREGTQSAPASGAIE
ncbi:MAG: nicotinate-nucleotide adenylyltransferase [Gemmatimonadota bacterium]